MDALAGNCSLWNAPHENIGSKVFRLQSIGKMSRYVVDYFQFLYHWHFDTETDLTLFLLHLFLHYTTDARNFSWPVDTLPRLYGLRSCGYPSCK